MRNNVLYHIMIFFIACCFIFSLPTLSHANKIPEFRTNLGGLPISCSIYSDQATINNVKSSYRLKDVYAVLGKPSSEYKREGITYVNYEGLYFTFADYSGDGNLSIRSITTAHKSGATTIDGVKPGMSEDFSMRVWAIILLIPIFLQLKYLLQYTYHPNRNRLLSSLGAWELPLCLIGITTRSVGRQLALSLLWMIINDDITE